MMAITLDNDLARISIRPDLGAGAIGYDVYNGVAWQPIFRRVADGTEHPFQLSNVLLVPFSGRVSGGGFTFEGQFHAIERNISTEKYPIHGNAFAMPWSITGQTRESLTLELSAAGPGPFRYDAEMRYALEGPSLVMHLSVINRGIRLPFGVGFHPWFVRDRDTRLTASADEVWLERDDHLPAAKNAIAQHADMDFNEPRQLPNRWINNWFRGWDGNAQISWPGRGLNATITASEELDQYVVFSPSADADFFCFEPVSHPVDAFNLPGGAARHGMKVLEQDETITASMSIRPGKIGD
ncbi:aldose 1-epimerase [Rhizobium lusitanum]|nr:aldose 1-epimerase [Rhizobium lusitanum]